MEDILDGLIEAVQTKTLEEPDWKFTGAPKEAETDSFGDEWGTVQDKAQPADDIPPSDDPRFGTW